MNRVTSWYIPYQVLSGHVTDVQDLKSILWLERFLRDSMNYSTLVLTSHDQVFLDRLSEQTIALRNHQLDYFDGTPSLMQSVEAEERVHKEKMASALDKKREHVRLPAIRKIDSHSYISDRIIHHPRSKDGQSGRGRR
jgi:ATPase subunit of ABC transporter with duplicated ATPase domains